MSTLKAGSALRDHRVRGEPKLFGRLIHVDLVADLAVIVKFPDTNKHGQRKNYVRRPMIVAATALLAQIDRSELSVVDFEVPSHWLMSDHQLANESTSGLERASRRKLAGWLERRNKAYSLIQPLVQNRTIEEIVLDPAFDGWPTKRALELKMSSASRIQRALNAYLLALGHKNGLLPSFNNCGAPGVKKISKKKTGRPREHARDGDGPQMHGQNTDQATRHMFEMGWKKHKRPGVSVRQAFNATLNEWFAESTRWDGVKAIVKLKAEAFHFTQSQFEYWGTRGSSALSASAVEGGETAVRRRYLQRQGNLKDRYLTANGEAFLDSTSCDQTLISCSSRLKVLSSPWRTDVMGAATDYIFGHFVGFENPSAMTALMAILHAAEDKVEYCARFGIKIKSRDWLPMTFRQFVMDNGEGKGQLALNTLESMASGASFGSAYNAINKASQESKHASTQRHVDHRMPAATMGRRARRGEPDRAVLARLNFYEYMPHLINHVLHHNNEEVIKLPTLEMRRDGVEPTRRGVVEWQMAQGYMTSVATDLQALKIRCLPQLSACLQADGLHLYDPTYSGQRIIPCLTYTSDWLQNSGMLERAAAHRWKLDAHIDPSNLSEVWANLSGMKQLFLKTSDPDMLQMTLLDWLVVSNDDRLVGFLSRVGQTQAGVNMVASIKRATATANRERNAEIKLTGAQPSKGELKRNKRDNTAAERSALSGIPKPPKTPASTQQVPIAHGSLGEPVSQPTTAINDDLAAAIRALRQS
jgi:hypothetical protein